MKIVVVLIVVAVAVAALWSWTKMPGILDYWIKQGKKDDKSIK